MSEVRILNALDLPWSAGLVLVAAGIVLLVFGSKWRDFTEVLSASFFGGALGLVVTPPLGVSPVWPALGACVAAGALAIVFRRVSMIILSGIVVGLSLGVAVHLLMQWPMQEYLAPNLSSDQVLTVVVGPDWVGSPAALALLVGGVLLGVIASILSSTWTRRTVMGLEGGLALVLGIGLLMGEFFAAYLPPGYPMKYSQVAVVVWLELAVLGVLTQRLADRRGKGDDRQEKDDAGMQDGEEAM